MEKAHHEFLIVHDNEEQEEQEEQEELEDVALKRITLKDNNLVTFVTSFPSSVSNGGGLSNGDFTLVTDPNGYSLQKEEEVEETANVGENSICFYGFKETATNGGAIAGVTFAADVSHNKNSVYFDKQQGVWKCHHCTWTKRFDSPWTVPIDLLMNVKTMIQNGPCVVCEIKGDEVNGLYRVQNGDANKSVCPTKHEESDFDVQVENSAIQNSLCSDVNSQCIKTAVDKVPSSTELSSLHNSSDIQATADANFHEEIEEVGPNLIKETEQQEKEFDVELVLAKQETHDLFCPNCKSCITKRVILKKRKRNTHNLDNKAKRDRSDLVSPELVPAPEANQGDHANVMPESTIPEPPADNDHPEREVEVFRCLSCLSIFIPSGKGFNLFRNFGGASKSETSQNPSGITERISQNPSNLPGSNANWFISLFNSNKEKIATEQGNTSFEHSSSLAAQNNPTSINSNMPSSPEIGHPDRLLADTALVKNAQPMSDINDGHGSINSQVSSNGVQSAGKEFIDYPTKEQSLTEKLRTNEDEKMKTSVVTTKTNTVEVMSSVSSSNETVSKYESVQSVTSTTRVMLSNSEETAKDAISNPCEEGTEFRGPTATGSPILENSQKYIDNTPAIVKNTDSLSREGPGFRGEVIVLVEGEPNESTPFLTDDNVPVDGAITTGYQPQVGLGEEPRHEISEPRQWEILKGIVYGGLVESITSLGIVSSAASSGATPLNIIALGFANLIGGLFILGHNLHDLKNGHSRGEQLLANTQDRYQELLGRGENFCLHAFVAILSFLIFGAVPLVIYGLLINTNYYAEVKLAIVAATSVVCIILLVIAKVYTKGPPKSYIKTVLYYVTMALATSGLSYMAGNLFKDLLDKFSHSESGFAITMPISDTSMEKTWRSY